MREGGYLVANVHASLDGEAFVARESHRDTLGQILVERYLVAADDGWILRRARYYRGALQEEGERRAARRLLFALAQDPWWLGRGYLARRTAARLLEHGAEAGAVTRMRRLSAALAVKDPPFQPIRNKIHVRPQRADADAARAAEYAELAALVDEVFSPLGAVEALRHLAAEAKEQARVARLAAEGAARLAAAENARALRRVGAAAARAARRGRGPERAAGA